MSAPTISLDEAKKWIESGEAVVIDVREQDEFEAEHIPGTVNIPVSSFESGDVVEKAGDKKVVFMCRSGRRAENALTIFTGETGKDAWCMEGSIMAWKEQGYPTQPGNSAAA